MPPTVLFTLLISLASLSCTPWIITISLSARSLSFQTLHRLCQHFFQGFHSYLYSSSITLIFLAFPQHCPAFSTSPLAYGSYLGHKQCTAYKPSKVGILLFLQTLEKFDGYACIILWHHNPHTVPCGYLCLFVFPAPQVHVGCGWLCYNSWLFSVCFRSCSTRQLSRSSSAQLLTAGAFCCVTWAVVAATYLDNKVGNGLHHLLQKRIKLY